MSFSEKTEQKLHLICPACKKPFAASGITGKSDLCSCISDTVSEAGAEKQDPNEKVEGAVFQDVLPAGYEAIALLGEGGMGRVYKAYHKELDCFFAVKILEKKLFKDKAGMKRFEREFAALRDLDSPNVAAVISHGVTPDDAPYMVMEYVDGLSLAQVIEKEGRLPSVRALNIAVEACDALHQAHAKSIIHRDFKPANIMLAHAGSRAEGIKLVDFGIAKINQESGPNTQSLTETGDIVGSPLYMSPEQCKGESLDERSDIYSLGCVMYEAVMGAPPFSGSNPVQTILKHIGEAPPAVKPGLISGDFEYVIRRCLEKDPAKRYESVDALRRDLMAVLAGRPVARIVRVGRYSSERKALFRRLSLVFGICFVLVTFLAKLSGDAVLNASITPVAVSHQNAAVGTDHWYNKQGLAYFELQEYAKALECFNQAIKLNPKNSDSYAYRARTYNRTSQIDLAIADATKAIELDPKNASAYVRRAWSYSAIGQPQKAIQDCDTALALDPTNADALGNRSGAKIALTQYDSAIEDANQAIKLDPTSAKPFVNRGSALLFLDRYSEALKDCQTAIKLAPRESPAYINACSCNVEMSRFAEALNYAKSAVLLEPGLAAGHNSVGVSLMGLEQYDEAKAAFDEAIRLDPNEFLPYRNRSHLLEKTGHPEQAKADAAMAKKLEAAAKKNPRFYSNNFTL